MFASCRLLLQCGDQSFEPYHRNSGAARVDKPRHGIRVVDGIEFHSFFEYALARVDQERNRCGKNKAIAEFAADKKAFHDAKTQAQTHVDAIAAEIGKLRADLKTQAAEVKAKTITRIAELTKELDAKRKEKRDQIEARLKVLGGRMETIEGELKLAAAETKAEMEAESKAALEEYEFARKALTTSLEADLTELKTRIAAASVALDGKDEAVQSEIRTKIADLQARYEAAQKKLQAIKDASVVAFGELHHGVRTAVAEVKSAARRAQEHIAAA